MKKQLLTLLLLMFIIIGNSQTAQDLFKSSGTQTYWLGIDFSHVKLIGDFSQFGGAGTTGPNTIKEQYFAKWNNLVLAEPNKYDVKGMLWKPSIEYDIEMMMEVNSNTAADEMVAYKAPNYTIDNVKEFSSSYETDDKDGIGVLFIAEAMNKNTQEAYYHFVAINMKTKEVLIHERIMGKPQGFGLRNYWAGAIYNTITKIKNVYYSKWQKEFK